MLIDYILFVIYEVVLVCVSVGVMSVLNECVIESSCLWSCHLLSGLHCKRGETWRYVWNAVKSV